MSITDLRAHLQLCGFLFSEDHEQDLSIPLMVYREALPESTTLSSLPFPCFTNLPFLLLFRRAILLLASDLQHVLVLLSPLQLINPLSFTFCPKIFLTRRGSPFCSLNRLHFSSWHLSQLEIMYFFRYYLSKISSSPDYKLQEIRDPMNFVHLCDLCHLAHSRCSKDIC